MAMKLGVLMATCWTEWPVTSGYEQDGPAVAYYFNPGGGLHKEPLLDPNTRGKLFACYLF